MNKADISLLSPDQTKKAIEDVIDYFATELDQEIGLIAADIEISLKK